MKLDFISGNEHKRRQRFARSPDDVYNPVTLRRKFRKQTLARMFCFNTLRGMERRNWWLMVADNISLGGASREASHEIKRKNVANRKAGMGKLSVTSPIISPTFACFHLSLQLQSFLFSLRCIREAFQWNILTFDFLRVFTVSLSLFS